MAEIHKVAAHGDVVRLTSILDGNAKLANTRKWLSRKTPLHFAVETGRKDAVALLLNKGAIASATDARGDTPLHRLYRYVYVDRSGGYGTADSQTIAAIVDLLVTHGANVDAANNAGATPLCMAALAGCRFTCGHLLSKGASINGATKGCATPLHSAVIRGFPDLAEFLLEKGADANARGTFGRFVNYTPLQMAYEMNKAHDAGKVYEQIINVLKQHGAK